MTQLDIFAVQARRVAEPVPARDSLAGARAQLMESGRWNNPGGVICPCCDQRAKVYKRRLNAGMARGLIAIYRYFARPDAEEWLAISPYLVGIRAYGGDVAKLDLWGLLEPKAGENRDDGSPRNGFHKATPLGWRFLRGEVTVPRFVMIYDAKALGFSEERTTIEEALGAPFNFAEIMAAAAAGASWPGT